MTPSLKELLTTYFPQVTLILGTIFSVILYFIKRRFDLKSKKFEVKYSLFQQNKIDAVKNYFIVYSTIERVLLKISTIKLSEGSYAIGELDKMTIQPIDNLVSADLYLSLFVEDSHRVLFKSITNNILQINSSFIDAFFVPRNNTTVIIRSNDLNYQVGVMKDANREILKKISSEIKASFLK